MTDYWISSKKHYCEVCKCWITGKSLNIKNHEASARHISALRNRMMESHKKQVEESKQKEFERSEMDRLNSITLDNPVSKPGTTVPYIRGPVFTPGPLIHSGTDVEAEKKRVLESITRRLSGIDTPEHVELNTRQSRWIAAIDQEFGTLIYYNQQTGLKTKVRPKDFDGVLPTASSSLMSNWVLKYDPTRKCQYYHNISTGELRWLADDPTLPKMSSAILPSMHHQTLDASGTTDVPSPPNKQETEVKIKKEDTHGSAPINYATTEVRVKAEPNYEPKIKPEPVEEPKFTSKAPEIGQWEVVKPEESAFSHCIESMEPYLKQPKEPIRDPNILDIIKEATYQAPLLNDDDMELVSKPTYSKNTSNDGGSITFSKRKIPRKK